MKPLTYSRVSDASCFAGNSSPELLLRRLAPVVYGLVAVTPKETRERFSEVRPLKITRMKVRRGLGVDDNHREWSFPPAEVVDGGGFSWQPRGVQVTICE